MDGQGSSLLLDLAVAWLRVGETENCIHCQNCESCLFPISAAAVHQQRKGSEEAIVYLNILLEKEPDHIIARWLLNIAHMTLGHPQDAIAEQFRLPPSSLKLARKDVDLAVSVGREFDVPMRLANLALMEMTEAINRGWGDRDSRVAMLLQEERAGVEVRVDVNELNAILEAEKNA